MKNNKEARKDFVRRVNALGFMQTELAALLDRSPRSVGYYIDGRRNITPAIWTRLGEIEKISREEQCHIIAKKRKRK